MDTYSFCTACRSGQVSVMNITIYYTRNYSVVLYSVLYVKYHLYISYGMLCVNLLHCMLYYVLTVEHRWSWRMGTDKSIKSYQAYKHFLPPTMMEYLENSSSGVQYSRSFFLAGIAKPFKSVVYNMVVLVCYISAT